MSEEKSIIVTFYSYKGGVGRSMALANTAWLLATKYNKNVLVVDWDLEAPGLHRFFDIKSEEISAGLIDLLYDYKNLLREEIKTPPKELIDINKYLKKIRAEDKTISIMAAGRQDSDYARKVNEFSWGEFYEKWEGYAFIEYIKGQFKKNVDFVLLDSRTGITDIGGICTLQLPDIVVLLFALNKQNIDGIDYIIQGIEDKATKANERKKSPKLIILPSRVERYLEQDKKDYWENEAAERLGKYLERTEEQSPLKFIKQKSIPYIGAYSFGETPLAAEKDPFGDLAESFDYLTTSILKRSDVDFVIPEDESPKNIQSTFFIRFSYFSGILYLLIFLTYLFWTDSSFFGIDKLSDTNLRLFLVSIFGGGIGGCSRIVFSIVSNSVKRELNLKQLQRFYFQLVFAMIFSAVFHLSIQSIDLLHKFTSSSAFILTISISTLIGLFSQQMMNRLFEIFSVVMSKNEERTNKNEKKSE